MHGFQIWLNLLASEKMKPAAYREILSTDIVQQRLPDGGMVRVIAGGVTIDLKSLRGPLPETSTHPVLLDAQLTPTKPLNYF